MSESDNSWSFSQFFAEMRRRHVVRFALGYAAAAFVILQLAEIVFPAFGIGEGGLRMLVVGTGLGFPPSLVLAWMYDLTTEGIRRTGPDAENPILGRVAVGGLLIATLAFTGALGVYLARRGVFENPIADSVGRAPVQLATYDPEAPIRSIAVLPLDDYSPDGDQGYFTASMHEELIAKLSSLQDVRVVSRTSVAQFEGTTLSMPEISRILDADVIVEGSVTRSGERIRVTLQLIHAPSDTHIQTMQWDREGVDDLLALQTEIAHDLVDEVSLQYDETVFTRTASNVTPEAQDAFLRGRYEYARGTEEGYQKAAEYFATALEAEPEFAPAMAGIAGARFLIELLDDDISMDEVSDAHDVAVAALRLDSTSMEAREVVALIERSMPGLIGDAPLIPAPTAEPHTIRIAAADGASDSLVIEMPQYDSAWVSAMTTLGERIQESVRRRTMPPRDQPGEMAFLDARRMAFMGRYSEAKALLRGSLRESPDNLLAWDLLLRSEIMTGSLDAAMRVARNWQESGVASAPTATEVEELNTRIESLGERGYWRWRVGRLERLRALDLHVPSMELASSYAALGESDLAIQYLVEAIAASEPGVSSLRFDPVWDELRSDRRVKEITRQLRAPRSSSEGPPRPR